MINAAFRFLLLNLLLIMPLYGAYYQGDAIDIYKTLEGNEDEEREIREFILLGDHFEPYLYDSARYYYQKAFQLLGNPRGESVLNLHPDTIAGLELYSLRSLALLCKEWGYYDDARMYYHKLLEKATGQNDPSWQARIWLSLGNIMHYQSNHLRALDKYHNSLLLARKANDREYEARALQNIGIMQQIMSNFPQAAEYIIEAMELYDQMQCLLGKASCRLVLGNIDFEYQDLPKALEHYQNAYSYFCKEEHKGGMLTSTMNIGLVLLDLNDYEKARVHFNRSMEMARELNDQRNISKNLHNIAMSFSRMGNPDTALEYYFKARETAQQIGFITGVAAANGNLASIYNDLKDYQTAIIYARQSLAQAIQINTLDDQVNAYGQLFRAYEGLGQPAKALEYHKLHKHYNDSVLNIESRKDINRLEALYQHRSMQQQVDLQRAQLEKKEYEILQQSLILSRQRMIRNGLITGFFALAVISGIIYWNLNQRKRANTLMANHNQRIEQINNKLKKRNQAIRKQRNKIGIQKQIIEDKNKTLVSGIRYAQRLQESLLPEENELKLLLGDHFLFFNPRDIISGDFFWVSHVNGKIIIAIADSTGHGVPGAFLSMLGLSFLKEYCSKREFTSAGSLLDEMRDFVVNTLQQEGRTNDMTEGFEMALVALDIKTRTLQYAGARSPLVIAGRQPVYLNQEPPNQNNGIVTVIPADSMPLAYHMKMKSFTTWELKLHKGDMMYLMTDGFADQLGEGNKNRFTSQRIINIIEQVYQSPSQDQKTSLQKAFASWRGNNQQVDDVSLLGIRIS